VPTPLSSSLVGTKGLVVNVRKPTMIQVRCEGKCTRGSMEPRARRGMESRLWSKQWPSKTVLGRHARLAYRNSGPPHSRRARVFQVELDEPITFVPRCPGRRVGTEVGLQAIDCEISPLDVDMMPPFSGSSSSKQNHFAKDAEFVACL
jgi:hypothetical protein